MNEFSANRPQDHMEIIFKSETRGFIAGAILTGTLVVLYKNVKLRLMSDRFIEDVEMSE